MITRGLSAILGTGIIIFALTIGQQRFIGLEAGQTGQLLLIILGAALVGVALAGKRLPARKLIKGYQQIAVILLNTLLFLVLLELLVIISFSAQFVARNVRQIPVDQELAVYEGADWLPTYLKEGAEVEKYDYSLYDLWKTKPYTGETINIDTNGRRVVPGSNCQPDSFRVELHGGSTMWGLGAPDRGTIPAYVQAALTEQFGERVCVVNQGELGFVSTQEVIRLMKQLQRDDLPDLVIFYDGVNDTVAAHSAGEAGVHRNLPTFNGIFQTSQRQNPLMTWLMNTYLVTFVRGLVTPPTTSETVTVDYEQLSREVVDIYLNNVKIGNTLAEAYGIKAVFLWQPIMVVGAKPLTTEEQAMTEVIPPDLLTMYQTVWAQVIASADPAQNLYSVADVFDGMEVPVYFDHHHLAPPGNEIVAKRIVEIITPTIMAALNNN
jgi:lysophospholipase L1-like esterase